MTAFSVTLLTLLYVASAECQTGQKDTDQLAINKVLDGINESFQKRDARLRASLFTEDGVFINAFGVRRDGRAAIEQFWKELFATGTFIQAEAKITGIAIKFLGRDVAIVDRFEEVTGQRGTETQRPLPQRRIHLTLIMKKTAEGWRMAYYSAADLRELATAR
jgi:uncharacterized protein (TIGR02246 family)